MKSLTIAIPEYRTPSRNKTITSHWRTYQKYRDQIAWFIKANAPRGKQASRGSVVVLEAHFKGKRCIDTSNIDDKLIIDGLMAADILFDDTPEWNPKITKEVIPQSGEDKLVIRIFDSDSR